LGLPACQLPTGGFPVHEPECQLVDHVALVQLDSVDTEPIDASNALTAPSEGVRRGHIGGVGVAQSRACTSSPSLRTIPASRS
jgi:hypothetical protein